MRYPRYWSVIGLLTLALVMLFRRGEGDHVPPSTPLDDFPVQVGSLASVDMPIDPEALAILGQGVFLNRIFTPVRTEADTPKPAPGSETSGPIGLFVAYFPTQRTGQSIHSPQNCLPGAGWTFESSGTTELIDASGRRSQVGDYVIVNGDQRAEVLYWYQSHGRAIASDYQAKLSMLVDSIRYSRSDAALVRIVTPIQSSEQRQNAHDRAVHFAQQLIPMLPTYIPN